ncbi:hypothetical protein [Steroidobacter agaridevorans]|uniref:hypothetical protein n=1 Tax=Steroidobacter agaridevorans TaxID=2695856 RepID=UPI0013297EEE|nr:hypothetical protein [Steroidobacter agaridevorans]GFE86919.1 hypothetical protein GCM10011488_18730 [Steroidobacter agaridevorans]
MSGRASAARPLLSSGHQFATTGLGIWRTDGTSNGTQRIVAPSASTALFEPAPLASIGSLALWGAKNPIDGAGIASYALWVSDGTAAGTFKLIESALGPMSLVGELPANVVVFRVAHSELWRTDGTVAGTWRLASFEQDATLGMERVSPIVSTLPREPPTRAPNCGLRMAGR